MQGAINRIKVDNRPDKRLFGMTDFLFQSPDHFRKSLLPHYLFNRVIQVL